MSSTPTINEQTATGTAPLPNHRRTRLVVVYAFLSLLAVVIGIIAASHRHGAAATGSIAAPTEQLIVATAPPGVPSPTPLATQPPSPTPVPPTAAPTEPPPTAAPPTPIPPTAPAVNAGQSGQHENGKGKKGKGRDHGD